MTDDTRNQETWTYAGIRQGATRTRIHAWIDSNGELPCFGKLESAVLGGWYHNVWVERETDGSVKNVA